VRLSRGPAHRRHPMSSLGLGGSTSPAFKDVYGAGAWSLRSGGVRNAQSWGCSAASRRRPADSLALRLRKVICPASALGRRASRGSPRGRAVCPSAVARPSASRVGRGLDPAQGSRWANGTRCLPACLGSRASLLPYSTSNSATRHATGQARSASAVTPFSFAQWAQQKVLPSASTPCPMIRQPQCSQLGAIAWIAHSNFASE
jgi:hypothetical protein